MNIVNDMITINFDYSNKNKFMINKFYLYKLIYLFYISL